MKTSEFATTETGEALQVILDCMSGLDGGIAYCMLKAALIQAEETKQDAVSAELIATTKQMAGIIKIVGNL